MLERLVEVYLAIPAVPVLGLLLKVMDAVRAVGNRMLPRNAALGSTMINQEEWDRDLPKLKGAGERLGALFTFASVEPMLGMIRTDQFPDWVIVGGESGRGARFMEHGWARLMMDQCAAAGKPFFLKQMTGKAPIPDDLLVRQLPVAA